MIFLDTSACIESLSGKELPPDIKSNTFAISTIVEMELWAGIKLLGATRKSKQERYRVERLLRSVQVFPFDSEAARKSAEVSSDLEKRGLRIDDPDVMIAGHALAMNLPVLTTNQKHFKRVKKLQVIDWR